MSCVDVCFLRCLPGGAEHATTLHLVCAFVTRPNMLCLTMFLTLDVDGWLFVCGWGVDEGGLHRCNLRKLRLRGPVDRALRFLHRVGGACG